MNKRYCQECNYELDNGYAPHEIICGACYNIEQGIQPLAEEGTEMNINELAEQVTEEQALELHYQFARKFGWAGTLYVREDAEYVWNADNGGDYEPISDAQWEAVKVTSAWSRLGEYISQDGLDLVREAVSVAKFNVKASQIYTVWIGGGEHNERLLTKGEAIDIAQWLVDEGYEDVQIVDTTTNIVVAQHEWANS